MWEDVRGSRGSGTQTTGGTPAHREAGVELEQNTPDPAPTWAREQVRADSLTDLVLGSGGPVSESSNYKDYKMNCTANLFYGVISYYNVTF